jgi:hypothetical protein
LANDNRVTVNGGVGFFGLLAIVLIALRLTGCIDWPWVWVLAPLWAPVALAVLVLLFGLAVWWVCERREF